MTPDAERAGAARDFDVFHAHDGIGGNALATLARRRLIPGFVRTVHHVDAFADPRLAYWTERSIVDAAQVLCVSRVWRGAIQREFGIDAEIVGNGVDTAAFGPEPAPGDAAVRATWGLGAGRSSWRAARRSSTTRATRPASGPTSNGSD